jgi:VanZ family protein
LTGPGFRRLWIAMLTALVAVIVTGSLLPFEVPGLDNGGDKLGHAFSYFALALAGAGIVAPERLWVVALRCLLLGLVLEIAQGLWLESRHADWRDLAANAAGVLCAWLIVRNGRSGWARYVEAWLRRR